MKMTTKKITPNLPNWLMAVLILAPVIYCRPAYSVPTPDFILVTLDDEIVDETFRLIGRTAIEPNRAYKIGALVINDSDQPVVGTTASYQIIENNGSASYLGSPEMLTTDGEGKAYQTFYSDATMHAKIVVVVTAVTPNGTLTSKLDLYIGGTGKTSQVTFSEPSTEKYLLGKDGGNNPVYYWVIPQEFTTRLEARLHDDLDYPINQGLVMFQIVDNSQPNVQLESPEQLTSNTQGVVYTTFPANAKPSINYKIECKTYSGYNGNTVTGFIQVIVASPSSDSKVITPFIQAYPNPFRPNAGDQLKVAYSLEKDQNVEIGFYTLTGKQFFQHSFSAGEASGGSRGYHEFQWDGKNRQGLYVSNGVYWCIIRSGDKELYRTKIGIYRE